MAIQKVVRGCDMVFIAAGMGGGTGTGSAPVVAELARETGALVIAVVTTPFSFEGTKRAEVALSGLRRLVDKVNSTIIVPNDHLLRLGDHDVPVGQAFAAADRVVAEGITEDSFNFKIEQADYYAAFHLNNTGNGNSGHYAGGPGGIPPEQQIPEPGILALMVAGMAGLVTMRRRRRHL